MSKKYPEAYAVTLHTLVGRTYLVLPSVEVDGPDAAEAVARRLWESGEDDGQLEYDKVDYVETTVVEP